MNPMAAIRRYRRLKDKAAAYAVLQREVDGALSCLAIGETPRVKRDVAQAALLGSPWMLNGRNLRVNGKSVGAGVWELRLETMNLTEAEMTKLKNTKNESEWNVVCDEIKAARNGTYPSDWFAKMMKTGLILAIAKTWK